MKIGLMGPFGYGNLGDAATQDAMIQHIRARLPHAELRGFSLNPEDTAARHGIESFAFSRLSSKQSPDGPVAKVAAWFARQKNPSVRDLQRWILRVPIELSLVAEARRHLSDIDLLIISGGGQIEDYWGGGGPWSYPYTLMKWCGLAKVLGAKIAVVSVGAGPIRHELSKLFLRWALSLADYRSYRDDFSRRLVRSIGVGDNDSVYPDLAFSLDLPKTSDVARDSGRVIAIGPVGYFRPDSWPEADGAIYATYRAKLSAFVRFLVERGDTVVFIPGEAHHDQVIISEIMESVGVGPGNAHRLRRPRIDTVTDLVRELANVSLVVASRFHNLVMAHMLQKPTIALSYQEKIDALMEAAGQSEFCFHIGDFQPEELQRRIVRLEADATAIRASLAQLCSAYRLQLDEQYERIFGLV